MNSETDDKLALVKQCNAYLEWLNTPVYGVGEPDLVAPFMADVARAMLAHLTREVVVTDDMVERGAKALASQLADITKNLSTPITLESIWRDFGQGFMEDARNVLTAALQKQLR